MASIFKLTGNLLDFQNFVAESEDLDEQTIRDTLEGLEGEIEEKIKDYAAVVKNLESDVAGMKQAEKDIATRRKALENNIARMRDVMDQTMQYAGKDRIEDERFVIAYRKCPPSLHVENEDKIPEEYWIPQDPTLDRKTALDLLKAGESIEGLSMITDKKNFYIK